MSHYREFTTDLIEWNKVAPEGSTHYAPRAGSWYKLENGEWFGFSEMHKVWRSCGNSYPAIAIEKPEF